MTDISLSYNISSSFWFTVLQLVFNCHDSVYESECLEQHLLSLIASDTIASLCIFHGLAVKCTQGSKYQSQQSSVDILIIALSETRRGTGILARLLGLHINNKQYIYVGWLLYFLRLTSSNLNHTTWRIETTPSHVVAEAKSIFYRLSRSRAKNAKRIFMQSERRRV